MKDRAYAKINLSLDVFRRREDGYHDLSSIMVPVTFYDELEIEKAETMSYATKKGRVYWNEHNTIVKMISLFKEKYHIEDNFSVTLTKSIPIKAGLAGGSSDAAAALRILEKMYGKLPEEDVHELCKAVGADVLFTYYRRPALVEGTGEKLSFFKIRKKYYVLLVKPASGISTKESYENLDLASCPHPNVPALKEALEKGEDIRPFLGNSLEEPALKLSKDVSRVKELLIKEGGRDPLMSGSGSAVFVISEEKGEIRRLQEKMKKYRLFTRFAEILC